MAGLVIVVGAGATGIAEAAGEAGLPAHRILLAADADEALELVRPRLRTGDIVLVKGSRGIGLDRLVEQLVLEAAT